MVDISGDLMGNLYTLGREIAAFKAYDPVGYIPDSAAAWGVLPWKGNIFFSDINSGLWSVRMQPPRRPVS